MRYLLILLFCFSVGVCEAAPYSLRTRTNNFYGRSKQPCRHGYVTSTRVIIIKKKSAPVKPWPPRYYGFSAPVSTGVRGRVVAPKPNPITIINPYVEQ